MRRTPVYKHPVRGQSMGYIELFFIAFIFSFGGIFIKSASQLVTAPVITWCRWSIGFVCLLLYMLVRKRPIRWHFAMRILWIGALVKSMHYFFENLGVSLGVSYGGILVWPAQTIVVTLFSVFLFKEKMTRRNFLSVLLCLTGIVVTSWKGELIGRTSLTQGLIRVLIFVVAGTGAALFTIVQKYLNSRMAPDNSCLNMYLMGSLITLLPVPFAGITPAHAGAVSGTAAGVSAAAGTAVTAAVSAVFAASAAASSWAAVGGLVCLGVITGFAFLIQADALRKVPMYIVPSIQSTTVILTIFWGWLFRHEQISPNVIAGTAIFIAGVLIMEKTGHAQEETQKQETV